MNRYYGKGPEPCWFRAGLCSCKTGLIVRRIPAEQCLRSNALEVSHTLPTTIRYAYPNAKTGHKFDYFYFYDRDGNFLLKVCLYDDIVGVSKKLDGKFSYYNTKDTIETEKLRQSVWATENRLRTEEKYGDMMQAMMDGFRYENGCYTFTVSAFGASSLNIEIYGNEEVFISKRYKSSDYEFEHTVKNNSIYYLSEHTEAMDWQQGETYSLPCGATVLMDRTISGLLTAWYLSLIVV